MNIVVIPARGGSKRIPRKNIRTFAGKQMIVWPIEAAQRSGLFDVILVSTDDEEIANVARRAGAEVPFRRPDELADDYTGTLEVMTHAAGWAHEEGILGPALCCLYPAAPFVLPEDLEAGRMLLESGGWDYVVAAAEHRKSVFRSFVRSRDGAAEMLFPQYREARSQDLPPVYYDAGSFYWGASQAWLQSRPIFGERTTILELPASRTLDIDTPEDWTAAERIFGNGKICDDSL
jgi:pseudaminic acid cytidylyltransferase